MASLHPSLPSGVNSVLTIVELAGAARFVPHPLDGLSFASALTSDPPPARAWRSFSFSEFHRRHDTWRAIRTIGDDGAAELAFHLWCTNQTEVFDEKTDPHQTVNLGADTAFGARAIDRYTAAAATLGSCAGAACHVMPERAAAPAFPLECFFPDGVGVHAGEGEGHAELELFFD